MKELIPLVLCIAISLIFFSAFVLAIDDWPKYHHDINNTGSSISSINITDFYLLWNYTGLITGKSSPTIVDNVVYILNDISENQYNCTISAINATTGIKIWSNTIYTESCNDEESSVAFSDGIVYFGLTKDNTFYALNATNGTKIWHYTTGDSIYSSPTVYNNIVYFGSDDNHVYALNATNGSQIWNYTLNFPFKGSPAIGNGIVYVNEYNRNCGVIYNCGVYALNATNGTKIWNYTLFINDDSSGLYGSPIFSDDIIYFGTNNDTVYALNATNGTKIWHFTASHSHSSDTGIYTTPTISDNILYITDDGYTGFTVYALNATNGSQIWKDEVTTASVIGHNPDTSSPVISDNILFVAYGSSFWSKIFAYNATNGTSLFVTGFYNSGEKRPGLAIYNERLYVHMINDLLVYGQNSPPDVELISPDNGYTSTSGTITFTANYSDPEGSAGDCELFINGTGYGTNTSVPNGTEFIIQNNATLDNGFYQWWVNCTDGCYDNYCYETRHTTKSEVWNFTIINHPPQVETPIIHYGNYTQTSVFFENDTTVIIQANVTDQEGVLDLDTTLIEIRNSTAVLVNNETMSINTTITNGFTYQYNYTTLTNMSVGTYTVVVCANDTQNAWGCNSATFTVRAVTIYNVSALTVQIYLTLDNTSYTTHIPGVGEYSFDNIITHSYSDVPHHYLASYISDKFVQGLVIFYRLPITVETIKNANTYTLKTDQYIENSNSFLVFTEGDWYTIENRLPLLEGSKEFLRKISPSFAYGLGVYYPVKAVLNYNRTMEINNTMTFEKGTTTLLVENKDTINNITPVITVDII